jgi:hypothetical protein
MMGALDTLRSLSGLIKSPPSDGGGNDLEARQRTAFVRSITQGYLDLYNNAPTLAQRQNYQKMLQGLVGKLPGPDQQVVAPLLRGTPLDPMEIKKNVFRQQFGERPQLTKPYEEDPMGYAYGLLAQQEYDARSAHFMTGVEKPLSRVIGLPNGDIAVRKQGGALAILTADELKAEGRAMAYGMPLEEFMTQDGIKYGESRRMVIGGRSVDVTPRYDVINKKKLPALEAETEAELGRQAAGRGGESSFTARQKNIFKEFLLEDPKAKYYATFKEKVLDDGEMSPQVFANKYLSKEFPGSVVVMTDIDKSRGWVDFLKGRDKGAPVEFFGGDNWVRGENFDMMVYPGQWASFEKDPAMYILDVENGTLRDSLGNLIPNPQEFVKGKGAPRVY